MKRGDSYTVTVNWAKGSLHARESGEVKCGRTCHSIHIETRPGGGFGTAVRQ